MSRKKTNGSTALATIAPAPPARQITRRQADDLLKERALELYHEARTKRDEQIHAFKSEYGRVDRFDHTILADLQRIQACLAAISGRQQRSSTTTGEPKVSKQVEMLGQLVGSISPYLATKRALELFAPIQQSDYVGWNGGAIGPEGHDDSVLAGFEIVEGQLGPENVTPTVDDDGEVCLHSEIEPFEDEPTRGSCTECGEEFGIAGADPQPVDEEEEAASEPACV